MQTTLEPSAFVSTVRPFLQAKDSAGLADMVRARWSREQIGRLLESADGSGFLYLIMPIRLNV